MMEGMARMVCLALAVTAMGCDLEIPGPTDDPPPPKPDVPAMTDPSAHPVPIEAVARYPLPGTAIPTSIQFSPAGDLTYLYSPADSLVQDLYVHDLPSGTRRKVFTPPEGGATEANLSPEEKLRRERLRMRSLGVTRYRWAKTANRLVVPLLGDLWVQDGVEAEARKVVDTEGKPALDPRFSPDGDALAYVRGGEVFVVSLDDGTPQQVSPTTASGRTHGEAEYIAQEEMDRTAGFWWAKTGERIAYTEVEERHIPVFRIAHHGRDTVSHEDHRYPFAGQPNARVGLFVAAASGEARPLALDLRTSGIAEDDDFYLARVHPMPDGAFMVEVENRAQTRLDLLRFATDGTARKVLTEEREPWINLHRLFEPITEGTHRGGFVWGSERTGFMHLHLYDRDGQPVRALTEGEWMVDALVDVDHEHGWVYFMATKADPTERHLYRVSLEGGEPQALTREPGMHSIVIDREHTRFVDTHSHLGSPPTIRVFALPSTADEAPTAVGEIAIDPDPRLTELDLQPPKLVRLTTRDGVELRGAIYKPKGEGPFPTVVNVYGGPHAQRVQNSWSLTADLRAQHLRSQGFLVFRLDNRGSARRGLAFEGALHRDMGNIEVQDQVDGVRWLVDQGLTDPARVGIYGWSYGGYMAAMALARAPETFKVAVAGAPVTHWDGYDTHYTERYMGTPQTNPQGYETSSVMAHVEGIEGKLMLVHGLIDENVHFRHTARLINALIGAGKDYELLLFPDERHMPRAEQDRVYMETKIRDFLVENL